MLRRKTAVMGLILGLMLLFSATAAFAASQGGTSQEGLQPQSSSAYIITPTQEITNPVALLIADYFGLAVDDISALHEDGLGYGEIAKAYLLSQLSGASAEELIARFLSGEGWGEIIKDLLGFSGLKGYNLGMIVSGREPITPTLTGQAKHIAEQFGTTITEVLTLREKGMSWGKIRQTLRSDPNLERNRIRESLRQTRGQHCGK